MLRKKVLKEIMNLSCQMKRDEFEIFTYSNKIYSEIMIIGTNFRRRQSRSRSPVKRRSISPNSKRRSRSPSKRKRSPYSPQRNPTKRFVICQIKIEKYNIFNNWLLLFFSRQRRSSSMSISRSRSPSTNNYRRYRESRSPSHRRNRSPYRRSRSISPRYRKSHSRYSKSPQRELVTTFFILFFSYFHETNF